MSDPLGAEVSALAATMQSPYAAFPSGHMAFALITGGIVATLGHARWFRLVGALYPLVVLTVIVASANHFWLDAAGGAVAAALGLAASRYA